MEGAVRFILFCLPVRYLELTVITLRREWSLSWRLADTFRHTESLTSQGDPGGWKRAFFRAAGGDVLVSL